MNSQVFYRVFSGFCMTGLLLLRCDGRFSTRYRQMMRYGGMESTNFSIRLTLYGQEKNGPLASRWRKPDTAGPADSSSEKCARMSRTVTQREDTPASSMYCSRRSGTSLCSRNYTASEKISGSGARGRSVSGARQLPTRCRSSRSCRVFREVYIRPTDCGCRPAGAGSLPRVHRSGR